MGLKPRVAMPILPQRKQRREDGAGPQVDGVSAWTSRISGREKEPNRRRNQADEETNGKRQPRPARDQNTLP